MTAVLVNGVSAQVSGTSFTARDVPLLEGGNTLTAAARDTNGHVGTCEHQRGARPDPAAHRDR